MGHQNLFRRSNKAVRWGPVVEYRLFARLRHVAGARRVVDGAFEAFVHTRNGDAHQSEQGLEWLIPDRGTEPEGVWSPVGGISDHTMRGASEADGVFFKVIKIDESSRISLGSRVMSYARHLELILAVFMVAMAVTGLFVIVKGLWTGEHGIVIYGLWAILGGIPLGLFVIEGLAAGISWALERLGLRRNSGSGATAAGRGDTDQR